MNKFVPNLDGIDHVNVYSKGKTELGRLLSNFAYTPFNCEYGDFVSVEGFWYWYITHDEHLRTLSGWKAKDYGKSQAKVANEPSKAILKHVYACKLVHHPKIHNMLKENPLPLAHYYVYGDKIIAPKRFEWTALLWNELK